MAKDEWSATSDHRTMAGGELWHHYTPSSLVTVSIADPGKMHPFRVFSGTNAEPLVTFKPDGTVDVHGDSYEAAKAFWDYVKQFAAAEYKKHAAGQG